MLYTKPCLWPDDDDDDEEEEEEEEEEIKLITCSHVIYVR
jgi:hypothetical protein